MCVWVSACFPHHVTYLLIDHSVPRSAGVSMPTQPVARQKMRTHSVLIKETAASVCCSCYLVCSESDILYTQRAKKDKMLHRSSSQPFSVRCSVLSDKLNFPFIHTKPHVLDIVYNIQLTGCYLVLWKVDCCHLFKYSLSLLKSFWSSLHSYCFHCEWLLDVSKVSPYFEVSISMAIQYIAS